MKKKMRDKNNFLIGILTKKEWILDNKNKKKNKKKKKKKKVDYLCI
jgi:hypothetical protein